MKIILNEVRSLVVQFLNFKKNTCNMWPHCFFKGLEIFIWVALFLCCLNVTASVAR